MMKYLKILMKYWLKCKKIEKSIKYKEILVDGYIFSNFVSGSTILDIYTLGYFKPWMRFSKFKMYWFQRINYWIFLFHSWMKSSPSNTRKAHGPVWKMILGSYPKTHSFILLLILWHMLFFSTFISKNLRNHLNSL